MIDRSPLPIRIVRKLAPLLFVGAALALAPQQTWSHPDETGVVEASLQALVDQGAISEAMHAAIDVLYENGQRTALGNHLDSLAERGAISADTRLYLNNLLRVGTPAPGSAEAPAPAGYSGNGNVHLLGTLNPRAPFTYYGDTSSGQLYEGLWGYASGNREYALLTHSQGLSIIDVTNPASPVELQFISGVGGRVHHDIDTHYDTASGKTYAYFGGQENEHLYSIDLSYLPGTISASGIVDLGRTNYAHTLQVTDGLLFANNAYSSLGCQMFDLAANPANPPLLTQSWSGAGRDCHDSFARNNLLYSADGFSGSWRIANISGIRGGSAPIFEGETTAKSGIYAHSGWLSDDSRYLYAFEEYNTEDINVFDVSDVANPVNVKTFQWSGDGSQNSIVHNGQVKGDLLFVAYYEAGFRVFDVSDPVNPLEVGKYETWRDPDGDGTFDKSITGNYNGAWNVYTGLPSGYVLVSDMRSGLFIFQITTPEPPEFTVPAAPTSLSATPVYSQRGKKSVLSGIDLAFIDNADDETDFVIERWAASGKGRSKTCAFEVALAAPARPGTGLTTYSDTNGSSATCLYRVAARNSAGTSAFVEVDVP